MMIRKPVHSQFRLIFPMTDNITDGHTTLLRDISESVREILLSTARLPIYGKIYSDQVSFFFSFVIKCMA
jgi:hypothetical protein